MHARPERRLPPADIRHILVVLDESAVAFCHGENPHTKPRFMAESMLDAILRHAEKRGTALTFVLGKTKPPETIERKIAAHAKIVPAALSAAYPDAIAVLDSEDAEIPSGLGANRGCNLILRLDRRDLPKLSSLCAALTGRYARLSIHLRGIEYFTADDLAAYAEELDKLAKALKALFAAGGRVEVNVLTDRMMLKEMRNCDAGVSHLAVAPDGRCAICPAFLAEGETVGRFDAKTGFDIKLPRNLERERGPLCARCDAFQCKRCVWLSKKLTGEFNVPSEQQCAIAHIEREASRLLLKELGRIEPFRRMPRIAELNYRDPLELLTGPLP